MTSEVIRITRQGLLGLAIEIGPLLQIYPEALPLVDRFRPNTYRTPPLALEAPLRAISVQLGLVCQWRVRRNGVFEDSPG
jgi:hypothetical protein